MTSLEEWIEPDFHQVNLDIEAHLKNERGYKLDAGESFPLPLKRYNHLIHEIDHCRRPDM